MNKTLGFLFVKKGAIAPFFMLFDVVKNIFPIFSKSIDKELRL